MRAGRGIHIVAWALVCIGPVGADEGMWLFNHPPRKLLKERYGFEPSADWLTHLQRASVRFNSGGSGSFVSADGLVMTNHHVGADMLQKISTPERNYLVEGFYARTLEQEIKAPDLELNVLMDIEDVTDRVNAAVKPDMSPAEAQRARRAVMNTIEKESLEKTGLRSDVVTLYNGGQYHLYRFKKYTDVRLVFAPEKDIAFFGGDPDNFEYPRYCLDVCFFRVYENGKPARIPQYLKWNEQGPQEGELVFVSGHPGRTDRLRTMAHLQFLRDLDMPLRLQLIRRREVLLRTYSERSLENARRAQDELFGYQNSRKARLGMLAGLMDPQIMSKKQAEEEALRRAVAARPERQARYGNAWTRIASTLETYRSFQRDYYLLEVGAAFNSELFGIARTLIRLAEETTKPNPERLREYNEAALDSLKQQLFSEAPIYEDLEIIKLADSLSMFLEMARERYETIRVAAGEGSQAAQARRLVHLAEKVLAGQSPQARAAQLVQGTKLRDVAVRKQLAEAGVQALRESTDPMIQLAWLVDDPARQVRKQYEEQVDEPLRQAYAQLAQARFDVYGQDVYPDATFTLRLAFGVVKGYEENGKKIPAWTTLGGVYEHARAHGYREPFVLPKSWMERKERLNLHTPFNFVSTCDIIGGNSGSPVVNRKGEVVGLIFDGNIYSLVLDFIYTEEQARAISVHTAAITEALRKVYDAQALAEELLAGHR